MRSVLVAAGLAALGARVGTGPILDALAGLTASTVLIALGLGAVATGASAMRWRAVGRAVGIEVPPGTAWAGIYRATLLNSVLPGGFLGDADRAVNAHGRERDRCEDPQRAARVVVLERTAGQITVFAAALAVVVTTAPTLLPRLIPDLTATTSEALMVAGVALGVALGGAGLIVVSSRGRRTLSRWLGAVRGQLAALGAELRGALLRPRTAAVVVGSSLLGFASLVGTFALAADVVGAPVPTAQLLPLCTVGLVAMAVPVNVGGWGPREVATATAFAAAGLGAPTGLAVAVLYGVLSLIGCLPGAAVCAADALGTRRPVGRDDAAAQPQARPSSRASSLARYAGEASLRP